MEDFGTFGTRVNEDPPFEHYITFRLIQTQAKLDAQLSEMLHDIAHLTLTEWRIVRMIGSNLGSTSTELTQVSGIDKGLFSRRLKGLISQGLVKSTTDRLDGRVHHLNLTDMGRALYEQTLPYMRRRHEALRSQLSEKEVDDLLNALDKLDSAADSLRY